MIGKQIAHRIDGATYCEIACIAPLPPPMCYGPGMNETLTIRLGEKLAHALLEESRRTGLPKGEIARQALDFRLQSSGKLSVIERHFGSMRGPADLSTNKAYRRNWNKKQR
jgi:ribbon-helix-helix CopG family protein